MIRTGIFTRTFIVVLIVPLLTIMIFVFLAVPRERTAILDVVEAQTHGMVSAVAEINANAFVSNDYGAVVDIGNQMLKSNAEIRYLVISRVDGPCFVHVHGSWEERPAGDALCSGGGTHAKGLVQKNSITQERVYQSSYPLEFSGIPWGTIRIGVSTTIFDERMRNLYGNLATIGAIGVTLAAFFSFLFARRLTMPLLQLRETTGRIIQGDHSARACVKTGDEIEMLADSFNAMTESMITLKNASDKARIRLESILASMSEGLVIIDRRMAVVKANKAAETLTGLRGDQLVGCLADSILGTEIVQHIRKLFEHEGHEASLQDECSVVNDAGVAIPVLFSAVHVADIDAVVCIMRDIQERKRAELELKRLNDELEQRVAERTLEVRKSEEKYRALFEYAGEAIFVVQNGCVHFWNPALQQMTGYTAEQLSGKRFADLVHSDDQVAFLDMMAKAEASAKSVTYDGLRLEQVNGAPLWVDVSCVVINWDAERALLLFAQNVTEHRDLQLQLFQAQKLEAIGTLAGGIAHDFNNILTGILGYVTLMIATRDPESADVERLRKVEQQVESARGLTRQLLGFARGGKYEMKTHDLNEVVRHALDMFGRTRQEIEIVLHLLEVPCAIDCDFGQIEQVLINLFVNAMHAMPLGGELHVTTRMRALEEDDLLHGLHAGRYVEVEVRDTGIGMDDETQQRIFEPFFTTKKLGGGTGLGLASAYGIMKNHGGVITVQSAPGKGAAFTCMFPASATAVLVRQQQLLQELVLGQGTILIIDDQEVIRSVSKEMLELIGYNVLVAESGAEGIALFAAHAAEIDLIILDMIMPGMSGSEAFQRLRAIRPDIRIILASGYSLEGEVADVLSWGCQGFLQKPFHSTQLAQKVAEVISGHP